MLKNVKNVEAHQPPLRVPAESGTLDTESSQSFSQRLLSGEVAGAPSSWRPIEGASAAEILTQHKDPLRAVVAGEAPAIIVRGALGRARARELSYRLLEGSGAKSAHGLFTVTASKPGRPPPQFGAFGVMLSRNIGQKPSKVARMAADYSRLYAQRGLGAPARLINATLGELAAGRAVGVARDVATNGTLTAGGCFRMHFNNGSFGQHFDSLRSADFASACGGRRPIRWASSSRGRHAQRFADLYRFGDMLAALVLLQRSERAAPGMSVINVHKDELLRDCDVPVAVTPHNTAPDFERRGMARWREKVAAATLPLPLAEGDLYIFNANRLHVVHPTAGERRRLSFGSFVGVSDEEVRIWS